MTNRIGRNNQSAILELPSRGVLSFRMREQMLARETRGCGQGGAVAALRIAQPAYTGLGWLRVRSEFPDTNAWESLWKKGAICRGRFFRGTLGCVLKENLHLYLDACVPDRTAPINNTCCKIVQILDRDKPVTTDQLGAELRMAKGQLRDALVDLGLRGMVIESPIGTWLLADRSNTPTATLDSESCFQAQAEVIRRFLNTYGTATVREIADWSSWPVRRIGKVMEFLSDAELVALCILDTAPDMLQYVCVEDIARIQEIQPIERFISIPDCFDPVVRAQKTDLEQRYGYGSSIPAFWHYIMLSGQWIGGLRIHHKQKMFWIEDMYLEEDVIADAQLASEVFKEIRRLSHHPIRIDNLNGVPADTPINREILSEQGCQVEQGAAMLYAV